MTANMTASDGDEDLIKILLATDIHLGYNETHSLRGDDTFITFEEILKIGLEKKVDFVLLGGDLFHDGRPSVSCLSRCMDLLNRYCMGDGEVKINVLSDPSEIFSFSANPMVNYMNPNLNVALPIFSIHGNHDDPLGYNAKCSLDMLSAAGLINYFGKYTNLQNDISMVPVLISKGETKVAIYGLGALKDKMATRLFQTEKVHIMQPENADDWFNIMVVHQNRACHNREECLHENLLPEAMNLIFWGHEHECRIDPEFNADKNFYVTQPGSSVATSLSEGEACPKQVGILYVKGQKFQIRPIPLKTVRPFVFDVVDMATEYRGEPSITISQEVQAFLEKRVEKMLKEANKQLTGHPKQPLPPLIRLRVDFHRPEELFNTVRFGLQFEGQVANPSDMIAIKRPQGARSIKPEFDQDAMDRAEPVMHSVEELVERYFTECEVSKRMQVLPAVALNEALVQHMKGDNQAFDIVLKKIKEKTVKSLMDKDLFDNDEILDALEGMQADNHDQVVAEVRNMLDGPREAAPAAAAALANGNGDSAFRSDEDSTEEQAAAPTRGRGTRARARARGARATTRGRTASASVSHDDDSMLDFDDAPPPPRPARGPGSRGGRGSRARGARGAKAARPADSPPPLNVTRTAKNGTGGNRMSRFFEDDDDD